MQRDEGGGAALDGIAAGLAVPFAAGEIGVDLAPRQPLEADHASRPGAAARRPSGASSATAVSTRWRRPDSSARQARASASVSALGRMRRPHGDHRVGGQHEGVRDRPRRRRAPWRRPGAGASARGRLAVERRFVDVGGLDRVGLEPICAQQVDGAGCGGQHEAGARGLSRAARGDGRLT